MAQSGKGIPAFPMGVPQRFTLCSQEAVVIVAIKVSVVVSAYWINVSSLAVKGKRNRGHPKK